VNLAGTSSDDFADLAARLDGVPGVAALELHLAGSEHFRVSERTVTRLVEVVRQETTLPLIAKLAPFDGDLRPIALAAAAAGVDAISLISGLPALSIDLHSRRVALVGGLSGPAIKPLALRFVYEVAREVRPAYPHVPIIGIGGISSASDALEFLMAGATAIQVGTIVFTNPRAGIEILEGIETFLQSEGIGELTEIIGAALP
jgi:dihydroorotate dehydrogenase (NAD+) catalytic subunit